MMALAAASSETILRRSALIASGACSPAEYRRMVAEKLRANQEATRVALSGGGPSAILAPYLKAARANAKRLRSKT